MTIRAIQYDDSRDNRSAKIKLTVAKVISYAFLVFLTVLSLFFFYLLLVNATRSNIQLSDGQLHLTFGNSFRTNLSNVFTNNQTDFDIIKGFTNSLLVALLTAILTCYFSALTAYGIYAYDFKLKKAAEVFILAVMMIPSQLSSVGFYQLAMKMGLNNQLWILIIPAIGAPATFFYMIQYLRATLPKDLIEASRMDGSSEFGTFNRIVLPIMKPAIAVQMIFAFVGSWNNLYMPSLLLTDSEKKTLPIMISQLQKTSWGNRDLGRDYMAILISIIPVVIIYIIMSKSIIKGVTSGSVKG